WEVQFVSQFGDALLIEGEPEMKLAERLERRVIRRDVCVHFCCEDGPPVRNGSALNFHEALGRQVVVDVARGADDLLLRFGLCKCAGRRVSKGEADQKGERALEEHGFSWSESIKTLGQMNVAAQLIQDSRCEVYNSWPARSEFRFSAD